MYVRISLCQFVIVELNSFLQSLNQPIYHPFCTLINTSKLITPKFDLNSLNFAIFRFEGRRRRRTRKDNIKCQFIFSSPPSYFHYCSEIFFFHTSFIILFGHKKCILSLQPMHSYIISHTKTISFVCFFFLLYFFLLFNNVHSSSFVEITVYIYMCSIHISFQVYDFIYFFLFLFFRFTLTFDV